MGREGGAAARRRLDQAAVASKTLSDALLTGALPPVLAGYARLVDRTTRWETEGRAHYDALVASGRPFACAFWHARLLMVYRILPGSGRPCHAVVSAHRDGEIIARTLGRLGADTVRGSARDPRKPDKEKHGASALKRLLGAMRDGSNAAITPDGPRGPRQRAQPGVAQLARLSGAPVLPVAWATSRGREMSTWDRFLLPYPNGKGAFVFGAPITVGRGPGAVETGRAAIEDALNAVTARADQAVGRVPALPAPREGVPA